MDGNFPNLGKKDRFPGTENTKDKKEEEKRSIWKVERKRKGTEKEREGAIKKKGEGKENKKGLSAKLLFFF